MTTSVPEPHREDLATTAAPDEVFLGLVYEDEELLRAEFEEIVAVSLDGPHPPAARPEAGPVPPGRPPRRRGEDVSDAAPRPRHSGSDGWARQRSPPGPGTRR
ncbi:hypothetical protein [Georgenia sp. AZ-5]|uniref:hypothetical protein n=1 Tax=Georgenia sp. AZ-5 TaxID=3367526 RepID=UPI003754ACB0